MYDSDDYQPQEIEGFGYQNDGQRVPNTYHSQTERVWCELSDLVAYQQWTEADAYLSSDYIKYCKDGQYGGPDYKLLSKLAMRWGVPVKAASAIKRFQQKLEEAEKASNETWDYTRKFEWRYENKRLYDLERAACPRVLVNVLGSQRYKQAKKYLNYAMGSGQNMDDEEIDTLINGLMEKRRVELGWADHQSNTNNRRQNEREQMIALTMGTHARLGATSPVQSCNSDCLRHIGTFHGDKWIMYEFCGDDPVSLSERVQRCRSAKENGNEAFKQKDWPVALAFYSHALFESRCTVQIGPTETSALLCNRSLVYLQRRSNGDVDRALRDAVLCTRMNPNWHKAWFRLGSAIEASGGETKDAVQAFAKALAIKPECTSLQGAMLSALQDQKKKKKKQQQQQSNKTKDTLKKAYHPFHTAVMNAVPSTLWGGYEETNGTGAPCTHCIQPGNEANLFLLMVDEAEMIGNTQGLLPNHLYEQVGELAICSMLHGHLDEEIVIKLLTKVLTVTGIQTGDDGHPWTIVLALCFALQLSTQGNGKKYDRRAANCYRKLLSVIAAEYGDDEIEEYFGEQGNKFVHEFIKEHGAH